MLQWEDEILREGGKGRTLLSSLPLLLLDRLTMIVYLCYS